MVIEIRESQHEQVDLEMDRVNLEINWRGSKCPLRYMPMLHNVIFKAQGPFSVSAQCSNSKDAFF